MKLTQKQIDALVYTTITIGIVYIVAIAIIYFS